MTYNQFHENTARPMINSLTRTKQHPYIEKAEEYANDFLSKSKNILPHVGRLFLISTFIEDGLRMCYQWSDQREYISSTWGCGWFLGACFVFVNLFGQIGASLMILARQKVDLGCYILFAIIALQTIGYSILWDTKFLARSLSLVGAVLLVIAENKRTTGNIFHRFPSMDDPSKNAKSKILLVGRILLVLMFLSLLKFSSAWTEVLRNLIGIVLIILITIGFKTRLFSVVMVLWLLVLNFYFNNFWHHKSTSIMHDFKKYDFFQTMTVIGGLIILIILGPGGLSIDEQKKMY